MNKRKQISVNLRIGPQTRTSQINIQALFYTNIDNESISSKSDDKIMSESQYKELITKIKLLATDMHIYERIKEII